MDFGMPNTYEKWDRIENGVKIGKVSAISWFTNIPHNHRNEELYLYKKYSADEYPKYENYLGFEVSKVADIPVDEYIEIEITDTEYEQWKSIYGEDIEIIG